MATINVEKTCSVLPQNHQTETSLLSDRDVNKILERKLGSGNFRLVDWKLEHRDEKGFLGQYYRLHISARCGVDEDETRSLQFFAKTLLASDNPMLKFLQRYDLYNKEITVYTDLMQRMGTDESPKWMVECYLCKHNAIIVLEDASLDGYATLDKYVVFDEEHCVWLLRTLSRFHSKSLILDEKLRREGNDQTIFDLYGHLLTEPVFNENDSESKRLLACGIKGVYAIIDLIEDLDDNAKVNLKRRFTVWAQNIPRLLAPSKRHRNIICHRDTWANNIMFRHDAAGKPNGCYLIDWQFITYCPPAIDFAFCLYLNTNRAIRDRNFDTFAKIYHDSLAEYLTEEGLDINNHLSWTAFRESFAEARNIALIFASLGLHVFMLSNSGMEGFYEETKENEQTYGDMRAKIVKQQCEKIPAYKTRVLEIVHEIKDRLPECPPNP